MSYNRVKNKEVKLRVTPSRAPDGAHQPKSWEHRRGGRRQDPQIKIGNCYHNFPELYDLLYQRYLKTIPTFTALVEKNTPERGTILDIAAGTGEVTIPLLKTGYRVTSFDQASGMLAVLKKKASTKKLSPILKVGDMHRLHLTKQYDTICTRQAINYYRNERALLRGLRALRKLLKPGGALIFNAPNIPDSSYPPFPPSSHQYHSSATEAFVLETNHRVGPRITHRQDAIVWTAKGLPIHVIDSNSFYLFKKKMFEKLLAQAGFRSVKFYSSHLAPYRKSDRTLYGVARI